MLLTKLKMSAHDSFVVGPIALVLRLVVVGLVSSWSISHLVEASSSYRVEVVATSLIEVSIASSIVLEVASIVLIASPEAASSSSAITTTSPSALIAIIPLYTLEGKLHDLWRNRIIWLSQFRVSVSKMASLAKDAIVVGLEMSAPIRFVFLVDLVFTVLIHLLRVEVLLLIELIVLGLTHVHLIHLLLLHHVHLVRHHAWLHLHLHVVAHGHVRHLIRCVHLQFIL